MDKELVKFNAMVREWAAKQPPKYRKSALAFGFRCNMHTHRFDQTLKWISDQTRGRIGQDGYSEFVSARTLRRHLKVFERNGVIWVDRRRRNGQNCSSVYHVRFDKIITTEDVSGDPWDDAW